MSKMFAARAARYRRKRLQAYLLLLLGVVFLLLAWLLHPNYSLGVLLFGAGMLVASALNPYRLGAAGWLITLLGGAVFLFFQHLIPGSQVLSFYILAIGLGLLGIALMARRGYIGAGAVTPGILVVAAGIIEYVLIAGLTPPNFLAFMLSLWLPGIGLFVLGLIYLLMSGRR